MVVLGFVLQLTCLAWLIAADNCFELPCRLISAAAEDDDDYDDYDGDGDGDDADFVDDRQ